MGTYLIYWPMYKIEFRFTIPNQKTIKLNWKKIQCTVYTPTPTIVISFVSSSILHLFLLWIFSFKDIGEFHYLRLMTFCRYEFHLHFRHKVHFTAAKLCQLIRSLQNQRPGCKYHRNADLPPHSRYFPALNFSFSRAYPLNSRCRHFLPHYFPELQMDACLKYMTPLRSLYLANNSLSIKWSSKTGLN